MWCPSPNFPETISPNPCFSMFALMSFFHFSVSSNSFSLTQVELCAQPQGLRPSQGRFAGMAGKAGKSRVNVPSWMWVYWTRFLTCRRSPQLRRNVNEYTREYTSGLGVLVMYLDHGSSKADPLQGIGNCMVGDGEVFAQRCSGVCTGTSHY